MTSKTSLLTFVTLIVLTALFGRISSENSFSRDDLTNIRNIVVDDENGVIYVGGDMDLYKLNMDNLTTLSSIRTCVSPQNLSHNKILLKTNSNILIVCDIDDNGTCALYNATNLVSVPASRLYVYGNHTKTAVGLLTNTNNNTTLYVGLTYDRKTDKGRTYYLISNRATDPTDAFKIIEKKDNIDTKRQLKIKKGNQNSYHIYFRAVFQTETYVYFLTNQKFNTHSESPYVSKLIRICKNDDNFYSYIDLELECNSIKGDKFSLVQHGSLIELGDKLSSSEENLALVATFAVGTNPENPWTNMSAICVYTLKEIQERIIEAQTRIVSKCDRDGMLVYNESYTYVDITRPEKKPFCQNESFVKNYLSCTESSFESYGFLSSFDVKLNSTAIFTADDTILGKIAGRRMAGGYSELLVGTGKGDVKKFAMFNISLAAQYDTYNVDSGQPVEAIHLGKDEDYFLTSKKLVKVALSNCSKYRTCDECQASNNPHCGWCILEEKCNTKESCHTTENNTWLSTPTKCISQEISPKASSINTSETLKIRLNPFPLVEKGTYTCNFTRLNGSYIFGDVARRDNETLDCTSPNVTTHTAAELAIYMTKNNQTVKLTSLAFLFYSCSQFSRCIACTSESDGRCNWCVSSDTVMCNTNSSCTTNYTYLQQQQYLIELTINEAFEKKAEKCPRLLDSRGKLFAASGYVTDYSFIAENLPDVGNFTCNVDGSPNFTTSINRTRMPMLVTSKIYIQNAKDAKQYYPLQLLYPNKYTVDDEYKNQVEVYNCDKLGPDCSQCREYEADNKGPYHCRWCNNITTSSASCFYKTSCKNQSVPCGPPEISSFVPSDGPIGGGTIITIRGKNFGISADDIDNITVAGTNCTKETFDVRGNLTCITTSSVNEIQGPISISVHGKSGQHGIFIFKAPNITDVSPTTGPMAGGTKITISGTNLLIGNQNIQVNVSDRTNSRSCMIHEHPSEISAGIRDNIVCKTPPMEKIQTASIIVTFDNQTVKDGSKNFTYLENPVIENIQPNKSMASGGIKLTITGKYLNNAHDIQIGTADKYNMSEPCKVDDSGTRMICNTPELSKEQKVNLGQSNRRRRSTIGLCAGCFEIVIKLDGFESRFTITYTVDPSLLNLTGDNSVHIFSPSKDRTLTLQGKNLLWEREDITISIGYENCILVEVTNSSLSCSPPAQQPRSDHTFPDVSVKIGKFKQNVGYLRYEIEILSQTVIIIIASIAGVLFLVLVMVAVICFRKSRHLSRKAEELEKQIQDWEMEIRNVSREEFADLQTSIKEVTSSLVERGFPYRDYQYYSFKMLFPTADMETHTIMLDPEVSDVMRIRLKKGMDMLKDLIFNKFFLKSLIQTMERQSQKKFSQRERAHFSSVLSVVLLGKMEYFYEILEILLPGLVQESINKKLHKALFRRCESVTEKLLMNLFSLCLYPYLKKHGSSLYMMFKAIQIRMEKGPIDQLTGHAKYTLSEDQLLTKQSATGNELVLEFEPMKLSVSVLDQYYECIVLDCDTITQVKDKCLAQIYISFPRSSRGTADDVVLEWHAGSSGCLQLHDLDVSNRVSDGWKRLNTLAHYNVCDGCKMALVETNTQEEDYVNPSHEQIQFEMTGASESVQLMPSSPPSSNSDAETPQDLKLWHVVKLEDESQKRGKTKDMVELYLNRLLSMKISILPYIKELFDSILDANGVPTMVKTIYDLLDDLADQHKVDEDTLHVWKSHSYLIRFWTGLITKPDVVFDINKPGYTDQCLEIISQTFIDSLSTTSHNVNKKSATHKLLFTAEIDEYHDKVHKFYSDVTSASAVPAADFQQDMKELNKDQNQELAYSKMSALYELFKVIDSFMVDIIDDLQESPEARTLRLADRLDELVSIIKESEEEPSYSKLPDRHE